MNYSDKTRDLKDEDKDYFENCHNLILTSQIKKSLLRNELGCLSLTKMRTSFQDLVLCNSRTLKGGVVSYEGLFLKANGDKDKGFIAVEYSSGRDLYVVRSLDIKADQITVLEKTEDVYADELNETIYRHFTKHFCHCGEQSPIY